MGICDDLKNWNSKDWGYGDRLQAVRDWIKQESEEWGIEKPSVQVGVPADEHGASHWASYNKDEDIITMHPDLFKYPDQYSSEDVFNSAAHELRHAMQDQYDELDENNEEPDMEAEDREQDADDFAETYQSMWEKECGNPDNESAPGDDLPDWELDEYEDEEQDDDGRRPSGVAKTESETELGDFA